MLASLGVRVRHEGSEISVWPVERIPPLQLEISGDFSSAAPFLVGATASRRLRAPAPRRQPEPDPDRLPRCARADGRASDRLQPPLLGRRAGRRPRRALGRADGDDDRIARGAERGRRAAAVRARGGDGARQTAGCAAPRSCGRRSPTGSRRPPRLCAGSAPILTATPDGFSVRGVPTRFKGGSVETRGDHRIAMLAGIAGVLSREGVEIDDPGCVAVSFPDFFELLDEVARRDFIPGEIWTRTGIDDRGDRRAGRGRQEHGGADTRRAGWAFATWIRAPCTGRSPGSCSSAAPIRPTSRPWRRSGRANPVRLRQRWAHAHRRSAT